MPSLQFQDHDSFQRSALLMVGAGAISGVLSSQIAAGHLPIAVGMVAGFVVLAFAMAQAAVGARHLLGLGVLLSLCAFGIGKATAMSATAFVPFLIAAVLATAFAFRLSPTRKAITVVLAVAVAVLAFFVFRRIFFAAFFVSNVAAATVAGTAFAFVSVFAMIPRHVSLRNDELVSAFEETNSLVDGEMREIIVRAYHLSVEARSSLAPEDINRRTLEEGVLRLFSLAKKWANACGESHTLSADLLVDRMENLDKRIENSTDDIAREQFMQARQGLAEQLRYVKEIGANRERVLARMHNYMAALERLRMAIINLHSADATRCARESEDLQKESEELRADLDACSLELT